MVIEVSYNLFELRMVEYTLYRVSKNLLVPFQTVDKSVCTEDSGAAQLEAVLVALVERKARALHAEHARRRARTHPLLLLLRDHHLPDGWLYYSLSLF